MKHHGLILHLLSITCMLAAYFNGGASNYTNQNRTDFRDETIYFVMTTRFYDGDQTNNTYCWDANQAGNVANQDPEWRGDFKGIIEKLDYIKALGFTAIWVTPVVQNASGYDYHGYHAMDMSSVDRRLESDDTKFQDLIDAAHARGMKVILDIVLNHTGNFGEEHLCKLFDRNYNVPQSDLSQCMVPLTISQGGLLQDNYSHLNGSAQYSDRLSKMKNTDGHNHDNRNLWHHYGNFNWDEPNRWWAQIAGDCVDLNTENPATIDYLVDCYGTFIKMGVDGFRIDTGGHISRLSLNAAIVPAFKALGEQYKDKRLNQCPFYMFAEVCARFSDVTYRGQPSLSPYFYTWQSSPSLLSQWNSDPNYWESVEVYESTDPATLDNERLCLDEHNANLSESTQPRSNNALLEGNNYHTPDYSQASGLNVIDFTVHWNFQNAGRVWGVMDKDNLYNDATFNVNYVESHDYGPDSFDRFNGGTEQWAENLSLMFTMRGIPCLFQGGEIEFRKGVRIDEGTNITLKNSGRAYYGGYLKGNVETTDFGEYSSATGNVAATLSHPLVKHLQRLNKIRAAVPALRKGQYSKSGCSSNGGYAFKRRYTRGDIDSYALIALNAGATFAGVLNGTYTDVVTGNSITVTNGTLTTPSFSGKGNMRIYVLNGPGKIGDDGPFLYTSNKVSPTLLSYDGTEEEGDPATTYVSGGGSSSGGGVNIDDLEVYSPTIAGDDELSIFYESAPSNTFITLWVWNSSTNFTGGSWPGQNAILKGKTEDGTRLIFKWTYDGEFPATNMPTGLIFSQSGSNQTADLQFVNHGYYIDGMYNRTITEQEPIDPSIATLSVDKESGQYIDQVTVTITASFSNATIVYTTDGTAPTSQSPRATGSLTLTFDKTTTLRAGVLHNGVVKNTITRTYKISSSQAQRLHAFFIAPASWTNTIYCWAWNNSHSFTGGTWPGTACTLVGSELYNGLDIWEWDGGSTDDDLPTGIIFSNNKSPQTADYNFVNGAFYDENGIVTMTQGDVNLDGAVTSSDVTALYNAILGNDTTFRFNSDVNGDGSITAADVTVLYNILLGN